MKNNKGLVVPLLVAIIALLVVSGGMYIYSNKKAETPAIIDTGTQKINTKTSPINTQTNNSNLKTYTNTQYGFEVKYPESYSISGTPNDSNVTFKSTEACQLLVSGGGDWPTDCQSYNILVQQNKISGPEMSKTFVAGIQAEKYSDSNGQWSNGTQVLVQFQKGQNWYIQTFTFNQGKSQIAEGLMNQILSTFKFTK